MTGRRRVARLLFTATMALCVARSASAQAPVASGGGALLKGRVSEQATQRPLAQATITVEGTSLSARSDSDGTFRLRGVPPGPQVLQARRVGFAAARVTLVMPTEGELTRNIAMAETSLRLREVHVTADVSGRATGELGTATVITRDAIANQSAVSLAGVLELLPGAILQPPGLDNVQQIALRTVATTSGIAERLAAFGTLIILDGVPLSNNANLQTTGPRGEISPATPAGGGVDLRRIPAASIERVDIIRGVPSARYGDLTQGAIVIETRATALTPEFLARYDPRTSEANVVGGADFARRQTASAALDVARTLLAPGIREGDVWRATVDGAHRLALGGSTGDPLDARVTLDTRLNVYQILSNAPEQPDVQPGFSSSDRSGGARISERVRIGRLSDRHAELTTSVQREWQNTTNQQLLVRGAEPFSDRLSAGRSTGHFVGGLFPAAVHLDGAPWQLYSRLESVVPWSTAGSTTLVGGELRREWNAGPGYQFDIEFPPQVTFNGVNGFDRPRRFDAIPAIATSAAYVDQRFVRVTHAMAVEVQAGLRADALHDNSWWTPGIRDAVIQPRVNVQVAPSSSLRLRGGWGRTAKLPALADLYPAPQYYDVVNVNWYPPNPAERLAVLTTSIKDPTNATLGFAVGHKSDAGFELDIPRAQTTISVTWFHDGVTGGVGFDAAPTYLLREHFALSDSTVGTGRPPGYVTPAQSADTVPVFVDRPRNMQRILSQGVEGTFSFPEIPQLRTRFELQGAWVVTRLDNDALDVGQSPTVTQFQLDSLKKRTPYWLGLSERGERAVTTLRMVHHQAELGLVVTGTLQYYLKETTVQEGATDTLAWSGYVTRSGQLVPVPQDQRLDPQYAGLRQPRFNLLTQKRSPPPDWLFSLQVAKAIGEHGRLSFFAFNSFDRIGQLETITRAGRPYAGIRFGTELSLPLSSFVGGL